MKSTDLMIGDLVLYQRTSKIFDAVGVITELNIKSRFAGIIDIHYNNPMKLRLDDDLRPIPLTTEILKANGFISLNYDSRFVYKTSFEEDFEITKDNKGFHLRPVVIAKTNYVHELQHALRLCDLNELADNFKLK